MLWINRFWLFLRLLWDFSLILGEDSKGTQKSSSFPQRNACKRTSAVLMYQLSSGGPPAGTGQVVSVGAGADEELPAQCMQGTLQIVDVGLEGSSQQGPGCSLAAQEDMGPAARGRD